MSEFFLFFGLSLRILKSLLCTSRSGYRLLVHAHAIKASTAGCSYVDTLRTGAYTARIRTSFAPTSLADFLPNECGYSILSHASLIHLMSFRPRSYFQPPSQGKYSTPMLIKYCAKRFRCTYRSE